jgi:hypothetical protein
VERKKGKAMAVPKGYSQYSLPTMGGEQKQIYDLFKGQLSGGLPQAFQQLFGMSQGNEDVFSKLEAPLLNKFNREILPGIANRYAGSGISGSSGLQNSLASAATDLGTNLQAQRAQMMQQSMRDVLGLGEHLLGMPTQQFGLAKKPPSFWQSLGGILGQGLGTLGGTYGGLKLAGIGEKE